ncbi:MarR family transcriptional regulator [candidate division WOR-3 bacterium]|jgi:DNA-binding MarR family transcriptional regulator|nr:MarR family transcriptional regulator [candidate division WOR-3 bacterium]
MTNKKQSSIIEEKMRSINWETLKAGRSILKNYGLTDLQFDVLVTLFFYKEIETLTGVSSKLHLAKSTISSVFDKLERELYISRKRVISDKRVVNVRLLKKGKDMIHRVIKYRIKFIESLIENISQKDLTLLDSLLSKMLIKLSNTS